MNNFLINLFVKIKITLIWGDSNQYFALGVRKVRAANVHCQLLNFALNCDLLCCSDLLETILNLLTPGTCKSSLSGQLSFY